jgi:hypothetical protein
VVWGLLPAGMTEQLLHDSEPHLSAPYHFSDTFYSLDFSHLPTAIRQEEVIEVRYPTAQDGTYRRWPRCAASTVQRATLRGYRDLPEGFEVIFSEVQGEEKAGAAKPRLEMTATRPPTERSKRWGLISVPSRHWP